jgi:mRNA interferase HigB
MVQDERLIRLQCPLGVCVPGTVGELAPVPAECLPIRGPSIRRFHPETAVVPKMGAWYCFEMRVIARRTLREFVSSLAGHRDQPAVKAALDAWFHEASKARWNNMADVKQAYATASVVTAERIVFNIKGNSYRLVVAVDFEKGIVWIKWIGTHADYDRTDVTAVQHER